MSENKTPMQFKLSTTQGSARRGTLSFERGDIQTPAFMPVGTYGTVKGMLPRDIEATGAEIILGNTFHLMLRPGEEIVAKHGGLHGFMQWPKPVSYTPLRAHETSLHLVCRLLLEKKKIPEVIV